ncbi:uncharacterized protein C8A04DRAFT_33910 [Dichotomopilus funicola]|uniref:Uncharacterized protein n=1 Tax=Dichotomopilus funicola TaxID=1934379 RepID=A0AAN6VAH1_9PEZI|nr:hypothetical protein C8A04DRAFT_33910 [Dichotomopilus funicola]
MGNTQSTTSPPRDQHHHGLGLAGWDARAPYRTNGRHPPPPAPSRRPSLPPPSTSSPSFFSFQQGSERAQNVRHPSEASPLLGRFRAVPRSSGSTSRGLGQGGGGRSGLGFGARGSGSGMGGGGQMGLLSGDPGWRGSVYVGYGALVVAAVEEEEEEARERAGYGDHEGGDEVGCCGTGVARRFARRLADVWVDPKASVVRRVVDVWWSRWFTLVVLPALLAVSWVSIPFPQYPLASNDGELHPPGVPRAAPGSKVPGHGAARVRVNFWFFVFVYYSFYNLTALIWITKVFNLYSLNWWPQSLGFPITVSAIAVLSIAAPIPIYLIPESKFLTIHNTAWISWTFVIMAMPVAIAFLILTTNERHLKLRHTLSETQRLFTSSWWAGEPDPTPRSVGRRNRPALDPHAFEASLDASTVGFTDSHYQPPPITVRLRRRWLPASFVRFVWFCLALFIGLVAYVIGEAYAEIYLRTLPHNNLETIVYVYGWISTVYLLDGVTGWILGGNEGERVGSYPLSWIFKLYFMLTYQTYVRALYARLRSPEQFIALQILSSTGLIIVTPILMSAPFHWFLTVIGVNGQSYGSYQKICIRNVFIRFIAENASMLTFLGSVVVLHFGANKDVYPYFAFDGTEENEDYDFGLTFYASSITWACELVTSFIVAGLIRWFYRVSVVTEGKLDFIVWPELLPTCVAVMLHVLQNMLFSIIRLQFR